MLDKLQIARRLGAKLHRCERCQRWVAQRICVAELYGTQDQSRPLWVCRPCMPIIKDHNDRHVRRLIADEQGLRQAREDLKAFDRPSSREYREACQRMMAGDDW